MSEEITIFNGGEAPQAAKSATGSLAVGVAQGDVMQQSGGPAPAPGGEQAATADAVRQDLSGGEPPLGGGVHAPR